MSSWWTMSMTCWAGFSASDSSVPTVRSRMRATRSRTTVKLTSASSRARRISRRTSSTSASPRRPLPRSRLKIPSKRSESDSNMRVRSYPARPPTPAAAPARDGCPNRLYAAGHARTAVEEPASTRGDGGVGGGSQHRRGHDRRRPADGRVQRRRWRRQRRPVHHDGGGAPVQHHGADAGHPPGRPRPDPADSGSAELPALHAVRGTRPAIVDEADRQVILRGVNVNSIAEYAEDDPDLPPTVPVTDADFESMSAQGFNVVRLLVSWSRLEPTRGKVDAAYLREIRTTVRKAAEHGLYSVIDMHQDAWSPYVATPKGVTCPKGKSPGLVGTARRSGRPRRRARTAASAPTGRTATSTGRPGTASTPTPTTSSPDSSPCGGAWPPRWPPSPASAATTSSTSPTTGPTPAKTPDALGRFFARAITAIRAGEKAAKVDPKPIFFEYGVNGAAVPKDFSDDPGLVFAPHIYGGSIAPLSVEANWQLRAEPRRRLPDDAVAGRVGMVRGQRHQPRAPPHVRGAAGPGRRRRRLVAVAPGVRRSALDRRARREARRRDHRVPAQRLSRRREPRRHRRVARGGHPPVPAGRARSDRVAEQRRRRRHHVAACRRGAGAARSSTCGCPAARRRASPVRASPGWTPARVKGGWRVRATVCSAGLPGVRGRWPASRPPARRRSSARRRSAALAR